MKQINKPIKKIKKEKQDQGLNSAEDLQLQRDIETFANIIIETFLRQMNKEVEDFKEERLGGANGPIA